MHPTKGKPIKTFRQRRPDGNGGFVFNLDGIEPVIYNLPRVIQEARLGGLVIVVEGERKADALNRRGFCATTSPCGAGKWKNEFSDYLIGARVMILPDNDTPGREHARQVADSLREKARSVHIVTPPSINEGEDILDLINRENDIKAVLDECR